MPYKFEYQKNNKQISLTEEKEQFLTGHIADCWEKWDGLRKNNLEAIAAVEKAIYPENKPANRKMTISMPEIYEIRETYKAHLWKSWFSSLDTMFDVQGKNKEDNLNSSKQKAALIDVFRAIDLVCKLENGMESWINKGEFIAFVNWSTKIKKMRRKKQVDIENNAENQGNFMGKSPQYVIESQIIYDGPDITIVPPEAFVFDADKKHNFEACPKIYRSWATYEEIKANMLYSNFENLQEVSLKNASNSKICKGDQLEILEYWGDITLSDGTVLKNKVITLAGRQNIIRFEDNPFIINPFIFAAFLEDPITKRGYSPLYVALPLNDASETILNLQLEALKLIINKPYLAPKGALSGKINVKEGAVIEYDPALMPNQPVPLDFKDAIVGWDFLKFFESKIESTTGIFKYMIGSASGGNKTATETSGLIASQNIRISKEIDFLNYRVKLPLIRKIAELVSNFCFDVQEIKVSSQNGDVEFVSIDETIRQGNYDYLIGDSTAAFERKTKFKESLSFLFEMAKHPEVSPKIKWIDVMKWAFGQIGSVDVSMFIKD